MRQLILCSLCFFCVFGFADESGTLNHETLIAGGRIRSYMIHQPRQRADVDRLPVVIVLHGGGGNAEGMERITNWNRLADREKFIVVYPNGTGRLKNKLLTWNAGSCCGYAKEHAIDDVEFLKLLIQTLKQKYRVDPARIYLTGLSNGAMMTYRAACELSDQVAAIAPVAGALNIDCHPERPVSIVIFHGTADQHVPFDGGKGKKQLEPRMDRPVSHAVQFWVRANSCDATPSTRRNGKIVTEEYAGCSDHTAVKLYKLIDEGHTWPGGLQWSRWADAPTREISATEEIWNFFKQHQK